MKNYRDGLPRDACTSDTYVTCPLPYLFDVSTAKTGSMPSKTEPFIAWNTEKVATLLRQTPTGSSHLSLQADSNAIVSRSSKRPWMRHKRTSLL